MDRKIQQFLELVQQGIQAWTDAGKLLVEMVEEDPDIYEKILGRSNGLKLSNLVTLEQIGRRELLPMLLLDESWGAKRVLELGLPYDKQVELSERPIQVAVRKGAEVVTEYKRLPELSRHEAKIAITEKGLRPADEQVKMVQAEIVKDKEPPRYLIHGDRITFYAHSTFKRAELEQILGRMPVTAGESSRAVAA